MLPDGTVSRDYDTPFQLFMAAANAGCSCAYNNIGLYFELNLVNKQKYNQNNTKEALYYYSIGAQLGSVLSMYNLGYLLIRQHQAIGMKESNLPLLTNTSSNSALSVGMKDSSDGLDVENGLMWLRRAADCGHMDANFQLGVLYESVLDIIVRFLSCYYYYNDMHRGLEFLEIIVERMNNSSMCTRILIELEQVLPGLTVKMLRNYREKLLGIVLVLFITNK